MTSSAWLVVSACLACLAHGEVVELTDQTFDTVLGAIHPPAFVNLMAPWCDHCKVLKPELDEVSWAYGKYPADSVIIANFDADLHREISARFQIEKFPLLLWFPKDSNQFEVYTGERTSKAIINFINSKTELNAKGFRRRGYLTHVTGPKFDQIVLDPTKHVFVEFHAPWCGHCNQLKPVFEALAEVFADEPDVLIALVNADQYRDLAASQRVLGYPTLKFYSKTNKGGEDYSGGRDLETLVAFLNNKCDKQRTSRGKLLPIVGRAQQLDVLAEDFISADTTEQHTILEATAGLPFREAEAYTSVMKTILENGPAWLNNEIQRIENIIEYDRVKPAHVTALSQKLNVLKAFAKSPTSTLNDGIVLSD